MIETAAGILLFVTVSFAHRFLFTKGLLGNFGDVYQYAAPFRAFAANHLQRGEIPLWNPGIFAGAPFLASPQSALFYPGNLLFGSLPLSYAFNIFTAFHLFFNAFAMFLFLRSLRLGKSAALAGGLAWGFSLFFVTKCAAGHVIHLSGYAWLPVILLLGFKTFSSAGKNPAYPILTASALAIQFFSGHLQVSLYTAVLLGILFLKQSHSSGRENWKRFAGRGTALTALFLCLAAIQLLPTLNFLSRSTRSGETGPEAYAFATSYSMKPPDLITMIRPNHFGNPVSQNYADPEHPSTFFETQSLYFGIIPLLLSAAGLFLLIKRKRAFIPVLVLVFLMLALGGNGPVYPFAWKALSFQRVPARFYLMVLSGLLLAFAYAWNQYLKPCRPGVKIAALCLVWIDLLYFGHPFLWSENSKAHIGRSDAIDWIQIQQIHDRMHSHHSNAFPGNFRACTTAEISNPNKLMFFGLENVNGYEAVVPHSLMKFFRATQPRAGISSTGIDLSDPDAPSLRLFNLRYLATTRDWSAWALRFESAPLRIYENPAPLPAVFPLYERIDFAAPENLYAFLASADFKPEKHLLGITGEGGGIVRKLFTWPEAKLIEWSRTGSGEAEMEWENREKAPFWIFRSEAYDPGWRAWREDGEALPVFEADGYFQAAYVNSMTNATEKIYWRYRPSTFRTGVAISLAGALLLAAFGFKKLYGRTHRLSTRSEA